MKPGDTKNIPATVEFPDGSTKDVTIPVHKTETVEPKTRDVNTNGDGSLPSADTTVTNLGDLPEGTKVRWGEGAEETAKNLKPGESAKVPVVITIPGEGEKTVEVTVTRPKTETVEPKTRDVNTNGDGSLPSADTTVTNLGDLPEGTKVRWGEGAEETAKNLKPGESAKVPVVITIPGEGEKTVEVTVTRPKTETVEPKTRDVNTNGDGSLPSADTTVTNLGDLPE